MSKLRCPTTKTASTYFSLLDTAVIMARVRVRVRLTDEA